MIILYIIILYLLALDGTAIIVAAISGFFSLAGLVFIALINKKQTRIGKQLDGFTTKLVIAEKKVSEEIGKEKGKQEQKDETGTIASEVVKELINNPEVEVKKTNGEGGK